MHDVFQFDPSFFLDHFINVFMVFDFILQIKFMIFVFLMIMIMMTTTIIVIVMIIIIVVVKIIIYYNNNNYDNNSNNNGNCDNNRGHRGELGVKEEKRK
jgi:hypothetical protein